MIISFRPVKKPEYALIQDYDSWWSVDGYNWAMVYDSLHGNSVSERQKKARQEIQDAFWEANTHEEFAEKIRDIDRRYPLILNRYI